MKNRRHQPSADAGEPSVEVRFVQTKGTAVQLAAWQRLWRRLLADEGVCIDEPNGMQTKKNPAGGQDRTGLKTDACGTSAPLQENLDASTPHIVE
jgi:hypothetical protein